VIFALPWALLGLVGLPALAAIYFLRNRSRRIPVSSLMLWADLTRPRQGGRRVQRIQAPWLLLLELAVLTLLVLAACGPRIRAGGARQTLLVVLDDSFSMRAGGDDSPRTRAEKALAERLGGGRFNARFILASDQPQLLGESVTSPRDLGRRLEPWRCGAGRADLRKAIALAQAVGGPSAKVLVLTDHAPPGDLAEGQVVWQGFGRPEANLAIVSAMRASGDDQDRCLLQLANFSDTARRATVRLHTTGGEAKTLTRTVSLPAGKSATLFVDLPAGADVVRAELDDDALDTDNHVVLLPERRPPVRVTLDIADVALRKVVTSGLAATGLAKIVTAGADLVITDRPTGVAASPAWTVRAAADKKAEAFVGPFLIDRSHPLSEGLDLSGVVWAAAREPSLAGSAVISAGNVVLVTDSRGSDGGRLIRLRLQPKLSTLTETANWPVLWWNLLRYRAAALPGLSDVNARLGLPVRLSLPAGVESVELHHPDGRTEQRDGRAGVVFVRPDRCGLYTLQAGQGRHTFAVNALQMGESDLTRRAAGRWGEWVSATDARLHYRPIRWALLMAALGLLTLHLAWLGYGRKGAVQ